MLDGTPFSSYVVPGLILAGVVGGSAAASLVALLRSPGAGAATSIVAGSILLGWIAGEALILTAPQARSWAEIVYAAVGLLMVALGLMRQRAT